MTDKQPKPYSWHPKWKVPYAKACDLIDNQDVRVADACRIAGIERSLYYRIRKEMKGG